MGMDKQKLLGKKTLTDFEARWLADRNVAHPALVGRDIPAPGDLDDDAETDTEAFVPDPELLPPYEAMSHADLKAEAGGRGLPQSGSKTDLIERLQKDDAENAE